MALVGPVNGGLPTFQLPDLDGVGRLLPAAAGMALMSFIESISAARAFAARTDPPVDADRELLALGAANLAGGLFQAYPAGGGTSQTAINDGAGARTQVAELVTAAMAVLTLTLLASLLADLAQPILGRSSWSPPSGWSTWPGCGASAPSGSGTSGWGWWPWPGC